MGGGAPRPLPRISGPRSGPYAIGKPSNDGLRAHRPQARRRSVACLQRATMRSWLSTRQRSKRSAPSSAAPPKPSEFAMARAGFRVHDESAAKNLRPARFPEPAAAAADRAYVNIDNSSPAGAAERRMPGAAAHRLPQEAAPHKLLEAVPHRPPREVAHRPACSPRRRSRRHRHPQPRRPRRLGRSRSGSSRDSR